MSCWEDLPTDVIILIFSIRNAWLRRMRLIIHIQSRWRGYRTFILYHRFKMLRYLDPFRRFNPCLDTFLRRARL